MKKPKKLDKVKLTKELSRDRIGRVPSTKRLEKKEAIEKLADLLEEDEFAYVEG